MTADSKSAEILNNVTIHILITIDTDGVLRQFPNPIPNPDPKKPVGVAHNLGYMVAAAPARAISRNGTGDLAIQALVGDTISAWAMTPSQNANNAVLLYGMPRFAGDQVLSELKYQVLKRWTVVPFSDDQPMPPPPNPPREEERAFWTYRATVVSKGKESYVVMFALFTRDNRGRHKLHGYFGWDPTIDVPG